MPPAPRSSRRSAAPVARVTSRPAAVAVAVAVAVLSALALAAGCAADDTDDGTLDSDGDDTAIGSSRERALIEDLNAFWSDAADEYGFDFTPVPRARVTDGTDGVTCDRRIVDADDESLDENAFVDSGCAEGLIVAYDAEWVAEKPLRFETLLAHEWGHVLQAQDASIDAEGDEGSLPIDAELQADCFAGAWAGETLSAEDIDLARENVADFGDELHVPVDDPDAHGTPEERVDAFDLGADAGPAACFGEALYDVLPE